MRAVRRTLCRGVTCFAIALSSQRAVAAPKHFELEPTVGYAGTFTTGLSPYRAFVGLGVRANPAARLWLSGSLFAYAGASAAADGPGVTYRARDRAYAAEFDACFRFQFKRWLFEPGAALGAAWILGETYVTPTRIRDRYWVATVGPLVRLAVRVGPAAWGVEGAALYVPSYAAAPIVRAGALVFLPF